MSFVCVGNDVVDLANARTVGRAADERFVARVFDPDEREAVRSASEPDLELWCQWAAKEAGFKVISKLVGRPPPFVHRAFKVAWDAPANAPSAARDDGSTLGHDGPVIRRGVVTWGRQRARVSVALHARCVHAVGFASRGEAVSPVSISPRVASLDDTGTQWSASLEDLLPRFSEREAGAIYSLPSAAVRVGARAELATLLSVAEHRLEIVCAPGPNSRRPPLVLLDGSGTDADVSLSHDGRLIAWAVWVGLDSRNAS
jgi:phosphopantetheinyl transferase (holo-ACP synthase)